MRLLAVALVLASCSKSDPAPEQFVAPALGTKPHLFGALEGVTLGMTTGDLIGRVGPIHRTDNLPRGEDPELAYRDPAMARAMKSPPESDDLKLTRADIGIDLAIAPPPPPPPPGVAASVPRTWMSFWFARDRVHYRVYTSDGIIDKIEIEVPEHSVKELEKVWGPAARADQEKAYVFLDRERHVRARILGFSQYPVTITFERYLPLATIIDADPRRLLGRSVIGRSFEDVTNELSLRASEWFGDHGMLTPTEYASDYVSLTVQQADGVVTGWRLGMLLYEGSDAMYDETVALYTKLWGPPQEKSETAAVFVTDVATIELDRTDADITVSAR